MSRACTICWVYGGDGKTPVAHLNFLTHMEGIKESGVRVEGGGLGVQVSLKRSIGVWSPPRDRSGCQLPLTFRLRRGLQ